MYLLSLFMEFAVCLLLSGAVYGYWRRSGQPGFMLISAAFLVLALAPLLNCLIITFGVFALGFLVPVYTFAAKVNGAVLIYVGLHSLYTQAPREETAAARQPLDWPQRRRQMRRVFFGVAGGLLLLIAPPAAVAGGSGAGVAVVAALTGVGCLWLALSANSPLAPEAAPEIENSKSE